MNVLSLFDGMSCGRIALDKFEVKVTKYYASEIKGHAENVSKLNYPDIIRLGDVTKWRELDIDWSSIDLVIGGSPCQDLSQANKDRSGLNGIKSGLFYTYCDIVNHVKSVNKNMKFLLENVRPKKDMESIITDLMGVEPVVINSRLVSAQNRLRYYWANWSFPIPKDKGIELNDILESGYCNMEKSRCLLESDSRPLTNRLKMFHRYQKFLTLVFKDVDHYEECKAHYTKHYKGKSAKYIDENPVAGCDIYEDIRFLTKTERARLQTVDPMYVSTLSENDAACLLGDGWTIDVIAHIFSFMNTPLKKSVKEIKQMDLFN